MTLPASIWTPARIAELRRLFDEGLLYDEIGERMGLSKNTVIGKGRRLGFEARVEITPQSTTLSRLDALNIFPPGSRCQFPIGNPGSDGFHFCGAKTIESADPYCSDHRKVVCTNMSAFGARSAAWTDDRKMKQVADARRRGLAERGDAAAKKKRLLARAGG